MYNLQLLKASPPKLRIQHGLKNVKTSPKPCSYLYDEGEEIYLNIQMAPIFSAPRLQSIKIFNTKLQQSLKERQLQRYKKIQKNYPHNSIHNLQISNNQQKFQEKCSFIQDETRNITKTQFSKITRKKETHKKYSLDIKPEISQKKSIFYIPIIKADASQENDIFKQLITSESSKGLIERLIRRKNIARKVQEQSPKKLFRYPLNRKIFNRVCNKNKNAKSLTMIGSFNDSTSLQNEKSIENQICMFNPKRITSRPFDNIILSPSKRKQWRQTSKTYPRQIFCDTILQHDGQQFGPWNDSDHPTLDI